MKKKFDCYRWSAWLAIVLVFAASMVTMPVTHVQAAKKVCLNKKKVTLQVGQSATLKIKGVKKSVTWWSQNKSVAVVNAKGKVTAKREGITKIFARVADRTFRCKISVNQGGGAETTVRTKEYTFRSEQLLREHYEKHGREMGYEDAAAYVAGANRVISSPNALHKLEAEDGDHVYFLEDTGEIVFLSMDGYIRTYFKADIAYYNRQ